MTKEERQRLAALHGCSMLPASPDKRFVRLLYGAMQNVPGRAEQDLTPLQRARLEGLCWRYRRQLPPSLVPSTNPSEP